MALKFGTSGVRGLVTEMTDNNCYLYTLAFIRYVRTKTSVENVVVAGDYRSSTPRIVRAIAFAVKSENLILDNCGFIPTPALANYAFQTSSPGIMVTGSHIPDDRNGIKFYLPWGEVLKGDEAVITRNYEDLEKTDTNSRHVDAYPFDQTGAFNPSIFIDVDDINPQALQDYTTRYVNYFASDTLRGLRVVNYQHSAVARDVLPDIIRRLGAEVIDVGRSDRFIPVDTEAIDHPQKLAEWVRQYEADALVSADGDSDRPLLLDESGKIVRGDILGILVARFLAVDSVSTPVSCNTALELSNFFPNVRRTRIGSPYVIEAMNAAKKSGHKRVVGYEANGGFLTASDFVNANSEAVLKALPTRDAFLPILSILALAKQSNQPISKLVTELPQRATFSGLLREFSSEKGKRIVELFKTGQMEFATDFFPSHFGAVKSLDFTDGARVLFEKGDIIHFRPSGNAPEFRCYTESATDEPARKINEEALGLIKGLDISKFQNNTTSTVPIDPKVVNQRLANIMAINKAASNGDGMDIVIVSTTSDSQEHFWQKRLENTRGQITNADATILVVHEDWPGGAGNGLGTLYALSKANNKAQALYQIDIRERLRKGASIGLYHTAGKGTRLAPLPGSEVNNKPGVKLPGLVTVAGVARPITLLESVIKQTAIYAESRKGRISVFWGDQVFIPSVDVSYTPLHHVDILCQLGEMPDHAEWEKRGLQKYGLIAVGADGNASQIEKISHETATCLIDEGAISVINGIGISIGSFSISSDMADMFLEEFGRELTQKEGAYDADPHFWMPLTLDQKTYLGIMSSKGNDQETARKHYTRMKSFKQRFLDTHQDARIFGAVDIGEDSYWWDYGNIKAFMKNTSKLTKSDDEANAMRWFFNIEDPLYQCDLGGDVLINQSVVVNSKIKKGKVKNSLIVGVNADYLEVEDCVVIVASAPKIVATSALLYNLLDDKELYFDKYTVRADCLFPNSTHYTMLTSLDRDGGRDWKVRLPSNTMSYEQLYNLNQNVDIASVEALTTEQHGQIAEKFASDR